MTPVSLVQHLPLMKCHRTGAEFSQGVAPLRINKGLISLNATKAINMSAAMWKE
jgi:hypothetical protein